MEDDQLRYLDVDLVDIYLQLVILILLRKTSS